MKLLCLIILTAIAVQFVSSSYLRESSLSEQFNQLNADIESEFKLENIGKQLKQIVDHIEASPKREKYRDLRRSVLSLAKKPADCQSVRHSISLINRAINDELRPVDLLMRHLAKRRLAECPDLLEDKIYGRIFGKRMFDQIDERLAKSLPKDESREAIMKLIEQLALEDGALKRASDDLLALDENAEACSKKMGDLLFGVELALEMGPVNEEAKKWRRIERLVAGYHRDYQAKCRNHLTGELDKSYQSVPLKLINSLAKMMGEFLKFLVVDYRLELDLPLDSYEQLKSELKSDKNLRLMQLIQFFGEKNLASTLTGASKKDLLRNLVSEKDKQKLEGRAKNLDSLIIKYVASPCSELHHYLGDTIKSINYHEEHIVYRQKLSDSTIEDLRQKAPLIYLKLSDAICGSLLFSAFSRENKGKY